MRVKNWTKFQHFKDRRPPWIKLYRDLLDDRHWHELDGDTAKALVMIWLIASEDGGELPPASDLAFRLRVSDKQINAIISKLCHFLIQDDISPISERYHVDTPEKERETENNRTIEGDNNIIGRAPRSPRKQGTRLGHAWSPNPDGWMLAVGRLGDKGASEELLKFRDYWTARSGAGAVKLDWDATWRNWIRNAKGNPNGPREPSAKERWGNMLRDLTGEESGEDVAGGIPLSGPRRS